MRKRRSAQSRGQRTAREVVIAAGDDYRIVFDVVARDYAVEYRGQPAGWRATEAEARRLVERLRYEEARREESDVSRSYACEPQTRRRADV